MLKTNINIKKKFFIIIIIINCLIYYCFSQENSTFLLGCQFNKGFIMKHSKKMEGIIPAYPYGINFYIHWQKWDEQSWQYCFCYPRTGLVVHYNNFKSSPLGEAFAIFPYVEPILKAEKKIHSSMTFGIGPTFVSKIYDSIRNPQNICFSSHISFIVHGSAKLFYSLDKNLELTFSISLNHISNGGISKPNLGVNYILFATGINYHFRPLEYTVERHKLSKNLLDYKKRYDVLIFFTAKTVDRGYKRYPGVGFNSGFSFVIGRINAILVNLEAVNDLSDKEYIRKNNILDENNNYVDHKYFSCLLGHELLLGKFNFYQQLGYYIYSPYERRDRFYQRYGLNYYIKKNFFIGINLKAHREVADFLDFRIGFSKKN